MTTEEIKSFFIKELTIDISKSGFEDGDELFIKVIPADRLDKINTDYINLFEESNKLTDSSTTVTMERPVPYPAILIGIKVAEENRINDHDDGNDNNKGKGYSTYTPSVDMLTISVDEFKKPSLYITNYYWTNNK